MSDSEYDFNQAERARHSAEIDAMVRAGEDRRRARREEAANVMEWRDFLDDFDEWLCTICREGDAAYDSRTFHSCQHHQFHTACLERLSRRDIRCPVCRYPPWAPEVEFSQDTLPNFSQDTQPNFSQAAQSSPPFRLRRGNSMLNTPMVRAAGRFPGILRQVMPSNLRVNRFRPQVGRALGPAVCSYCNQPIEEVLHAFLNSCFHHMHSLCIIENL